ncbi:MAG: ABC transporter ATP-binding protein [Myxococcota bacterium]
MSVVIASELRYGVQTHFWQRRREILRGVSLAIEQGEIFGFLGPNGAGKTTTIKALLGLVRPDSGKVLLFERDARDPEVRRRLGYMPEQPYFPPHVSARELVTQHALLAGTTRRAAREHAAAVLDTVGLTRAADARLATYSKGMLQRAGLAQALVADPQLVVLDEPMSGLDPLGRHDVREIMRRLRDQGKTVFFSTHIIPDVELVADRVAMLSEGVVVRSGKLDELLAGTLRHVEIIVDGCTEAMRAELSTRVKDVSPTHDGCTRLRVRDSDAANEIIDYLRARGVVIQSMQLVRASLEELFVREAVTSRETGGESAWGK